MSARIVRVERVWVRIAVCCAVGAAAFGLDAWLSSDGASVLTAVIAAATVAYCWFTLDLVSAAWAERRDRRLEGQLVERRLLDRCLVELRQNASRRGQTHVWHAHMPFEMTAFREARHLFVKMPEELWDQIAKVATASERYNTVAAVNNSRVAPGSGMADSELTRLAAEAHQMQATAIPRLEMWIASEYAGLEPT